MDVKYRWSFIFVLTTVPMVLGSSFIPRPVGKRDFYKDTRIAYACEDHTMNLNCTSQNGIIRIIRANYGRFVLSTCNPWSVTSGWDLQCSSRDSYRIVAERCDGRALCSIVASNSVFKDPCRSTLKYLEVYYYCEKSAATTTTTTSTSTSTTTTTTASPSPSTTPASNSSTTTIANGEKVCDCEDHGTAYCEETTKICQCRENYSGTKCERCASGHFNYPLCTSCNCDSRATLPQICSEITGQCLCGPNLTPTCGSCLPGYVNYPFCQPDIGTTKKPTTTKPTDSSPMPIKRTTNPHMRTSSTTTPASSRYTCKARDSEGVWWPASKPGRVYRECPGDLKGTMTWLCTGRGWKKKPDLSNCVSPWLDNFEDLIYKKKCQDCRGFKCRLIKCMPGIDATDEKVEDVATTLYHKTASSKFSPGDLKKTAHDLFPKLNKQLRKQVEGLNREQRRNKVDKFAKSVLKTGSNLLSDPTSWKGLPRKERRRVATSLVVNMEETGYQIADSLEVGDPPVITRDPNIFMEVNAINSKSTKNKRLNFPSSLEDQREAGDVVMIPVESLKNSTSNGEVRIVFLIYKSLNEFMSPNNEEITEDSGDEDGDSENTGNETRSFIGTNIFSTSVNGRKTMFKLSQPLIFTLKHNQVIPAGFQPVCSFWKFNESLEGEWSGEGCSVLHNNKSSTTCQCDHMTNFAILMDVVGTEMTLEHQISLTAITYLGCIVSIVCLLCCIFTFCFFKNLQCDRNTIHKNLCLCLLLAEIIFVVGINLTPYKIVCAIVAGLLHFLFLASFSWMCLEGIQLYVMLVEVFEAERSRRLWYYLFGYGVPSIIVGVSAGVHYEGYGTDRHCWLKTEDYFIWSFVGPVCGVLLINVAMLGLAIYMMCRHSNTLASSLKAKEKSRLQKINGDPNSGSSSGSSREKSNLDSDIPSWLKGAVVLVVLLGLTWSFGVMYINRDSIVMAYIFTILNTFQGVFIFIFHCVMNEKVKKEYKKYAYRATWLPGCIRSMFTGYSASNMSTSPNSTSSGGNLLKFWSGRRRRKSSGSTLEKTSKGNKKRRSDLRSSDLESYSNISNSVSNHGNIYNPGYNRPNSNPYSNGYTHGYSYRNNNVNNGGIVGDLSVAECSVIDSEYVTEYCHNNMKVSNEKREYESGSEDECVVPQDNKNRLSILSEDSAVKNSDIVSTEPELSGSDEVSDEESESKTAQKEKEPLVPKTSDQIIINNLVNNIDNGGPKSPSLDQSTDSLSRSTPNINLIEGYESLLDASDSELLKDTNSGRNPVTRLSSDCPVKPDPHRFALDHSEC